MMKLRFEPDLDFQLQAVEVGKVGCGKAHFRAFRVLENPACYEVAVSVDQLLARSVAN